ncbi:MAG: hypothetical protein K8F90_18290, partial [Hyphomicrobiales bacterium]|nr:hypothetical protein [Hyphomicrobiales bacterium]
MYDAKQEETFTFFPISFPNIAGLLPKVIKTLHAFNNICPVNCMFKMCRQVNREFSVIKKTNGYMKKTKTIICNLLRTVPAYCSWVLLLLTANCQLPTAYAQAWQAGVFIEDPVTGTGGDVGQYLSMAVVNGNPARAYYDATHTNLMYVRATDASGTSWGTPQIIDATGQVAQYISLTVV